MLKQVREHVSIKRFKYTFLIHNEVSIPYQPLKKDYIEKLLVHQNTNSAMQLFILLSYSVTMNFFFMSAVEVPVSSPNSIFGRRTSTSGNDERSHTEIEEQHNEELSVLDLNFRKQGLLNGLSFHWGEAESLERIRSASAFEGFGFSPMKRKTIQKSLF